MRLKSIDIIRALTMLLMIFVNDLWTLSNIPEWPFTASTYLQAGFGIAVPVIFIVLDKFIEKLLV